MTLPYSLLRSQFTCAGMKAILIKGDRVFLLQVTNNPTHIIEKCKGRKIIFRSNWIQCSVDVFAFCFSLSSCFPLHCCCFFGVSGSTVAATPEFTTLSVNQSWQKHLSLPRNHTQTFRHPIRFKPLILSQAWESGTLTDLDLGHVSCPWD